MFYVNVVHTFEECWYIKVDEFNSLLLLLLCTSYGVLFMKYVHSTKGVFAMKKQHIQNSEPLRTSSQIDLVRELIANRTKEPLRNRLIFDIGINNGIRTNYILQLKVDDVVDDNGNPKANTTIIESKTGKKRVLRFNESIKNQINNYLDQRGFDSAWLFANYRNHNEPIKTQAVYRMFSRISNGMPTLKGLTAHSMRRTFGYHFYKQTHDVVTLMKIFNHSSQAITLRYIGIEREDINKELDNFAL